MTVFRRWILAVVATALLLAQLPARAGRVLLLEVSERPGEAQGWLEQTAEELVKAPAVDVEGTDFVESLPGDVPALVSSTEIDRLLDRAQQQYDDFEPDGAVRTLSEATSLISALEGSELGPIRLRFHWLSTLAEMGSGRTRNAQPHLDAIARLAPWWQPPPGYLTPELEAHLDDQLQQATADGAEVCAGGLPADARAWVDGFPVAQGALVASPGRHLVRVERPGFATELRWIELTRLASFEAPSPSQATWSVVTRERIRGALAGDLDPGAADLLTRLGRQAGADVVVVAARAAGDPPDRLHAALLRTGDGAWAENQDAIDPTRVAARVRVLLAPAPSDLRSRPVVPVAMIGIGAGGRVVGKTAPVLVAGSGGPSIDLGGGIAIRDRIEIRASVGIEIQGQARLEARGIDGPVEALQSGVLGHAGVVLGPRVPLGRRATLWATGGIGLAVGWIGTTIEGGELLGTVEPGLWASGTLGLDLNVADALVLGPDLGYEYGGVQLYGTLTGGDGTNYFYAPAFHVIRAGIHLSVRGR